MRTQLSPQEKRKFSDLLSQMIELISELKIGRVDDSLIDDYIRQVSKIDDKNPIKDLLLLKRSALDFNVELQPQASLYLMNFDEPIEI